MMENADKVQQGTNFKAMQAGNWAELMQYDTEIPGGKRARGKLFLQEILGLSGLEISINVLPAGKGVPFYHKHKENEEVYMFVKGSGQFQVDGEVIPIQEGTVIRVSPDGARTWRNNSSEDLFYIVIQGKEHSLTSSTISDGIPLPDKVEWK